MNGFVGQYEHQMDAKGRVSLPSAFRREADGDGDFEVEAFGKRCPARRSAMPFYDPENARLKG